MPSHARLPSGPPAQHPLPRALTACRICTERFQATATQHSPRPIAWFRRGARIQIVGQAPGLRVHEAGVPFWDASGDRLRTWLGLDIATFYDWRRIAVVPMAACFPGYDAKGSDLPPPPICAETWRARISSHLGPMPLTVLVGGYAQAWHLGRAETKGGVTATVARWREHAPAVFPLPHPSWRNTGWLKRNPWFADEVVPALQAQVAAVLASEDATL